MELKFTATITLSEAEIRNLIDAEVRRRFKDVNVLKVDYNVYQSNSYGGVIGVGGNGLIVTPTYNLSGASVTVEQTRKA